MMATFAEGKYAYGFCDRCGWRYELAELREEVVNGKPVGNRVCASCEDPDHPQNFIRLLKVDDPEAIQNTRPDLSLDESRSLWGWPTVYTPSSKCELGEFFVTTNA